MADGLENTKDNKPIYEYIIWVICNIFIPMAPFLFKWLVTLGSSNADVKSLTILEPSELLYYSFILCWIFICDIILKNKKPILGLILSVFAAIISLGNVIAIVITYSERMTSYFTRVYSYIVTGIIILTACIYKFIKEER